MCWGFAAARWRILSSMDMAAMYVLIQAELFVSGVYPSREARTSLNTGTYA